MQVLIGHIIAAASGSFVIDLVGSQDESNRPLVLKRSDTETSFPVLSAYGAVQIGHRDSLFSGMADVFGRVTSGSNHTHREHVLRNAPAERARFQESIVDVGSETVVVGTFVPTDLPDGTHQFFVDKQTAYRIRKATDAEGLRSMTFGPGVPEKAGSIRIGHGKNFFDFRADGVLLYLGGNPYKIITSTAAVVVAPVPDAKTDPLPVAALTVDPKEEAAKS